jgi:hypothetical protein
MKNTTIIIILLCVVFGAGGFFAGMKYQGGKNPSGGQFIGRLNGQGRTGANGNRAGFRPVTGDVISADNNSITVKLQDGSSSIVLLTSKTTINKAATASAADLVTGVRVSAFGTANTDGSMTASSIQINPLGGGMEGRGLDRNPSPTP